MRIFMAIHALLEWQRLLEIAAAVTARAIHLSMLTQERELCFRVVEVRAHPLH